MLLNGICHHGLRCFAFWLGIATDSILAKEWNGEEQAAEQHHLQNNCHKELKLVIFHPRAMIASVSLFAHGRFYLHVMAQVFAQHTRIMIRSTIRTNEQSLFTYLLASHGKYGINS